MIQVLQENKRPSLGQKFSNALGVGLQGTNQLYQQNQALEQQKQRNSKLSELLGYDVSQLPENMQMEALKNKFASQLQGEKFENETQKKAQELQGKLEPLQGAMDVLGRMRQLRKKGNLGIGSTYSPFGETRKEAGEYEQLGKSLIQHATNIPIRNRIEFETLAEQLYDPSITDAKAEGILNAMERIINNSMQSLGESQEVSRNQPQQKRPPLTAFQR